MTYPDTASGSRYACIMRDERAIDPRALGRNVRRLCKAQGITLEELAERAGLSSVKMLMKRGSGRMDNIARVAAALGVSVDDLLTEARNPTKELLEFLDTPMAKGVTEDERTELCNLDLPGRRMTVEAYYLALKMLRATEPDGA